jgi:ketosteroid isomerase-like protein
VTIWQKDKTGVWKVALDVGLNHPEPQEMETEIRIYVPNSPVSRPGSANTDLEKTQHSFAESLKDDEADAITDNASNDIRVFRSGQLPAVSKTAAEKSLSEHDAKTTRTPRGTGTSDPIDLAYEYGEYTSEHNKATEHGIYLCIWQLESDGTWKIALDFQKSAPTEKSGDAARGGVRLNHLFGNARRIKSPSQSEFATPSR